MYHSSSETQCARSSTLVALQADEPDFTRNKVRVFLNTHTCYELIPESGKVVILDVGLPIRQAFHALHEQVGTSTCCAACDCPA